jgi:hypothetical protein
MTVCTNIEVENKINFHWIQKHENLIVDIGPVVIRPGCECAPIVALQDSNFKPPNFKCVNGK